MSRALFIVLVLGLFTACGPADDCPPECLPLGTVSGFMLPCDPESGCPGVEAPPPVESWVSVTVRNDTASYRTFNAAWALNPGTSSHTTGWLITSEILAPGEVRFMPNALMALKGDTVLIGVSGYSLDDSSAWARAELEFTAPASPVSCTFSYQYEGPFPLVGASCPAGL